MTKNILDAIADPKLLASSFRDKATWERWFAFLAALFNLPMTPEQIATYRECTNRTEPPTEQVKQAWLICGRRSGKSRTLALIAVFLGCFHNYEKYLAPGERGTILILAKDRQQARTIFRYIRALLNETPMLKRMVERELAESFDLVNRITIEVGTANFRSVRGATIVAALLDELAFWQGEDSANPDREVITALKPAMITIPNAMLLCASSPYAKKGALYDAYTRYFGKDGPILVWNAPSTKMNPTIPQSEVDAAIEADPADASAEWLACFRDDIADFVQREVVMACVEIGVRERPPQLGKFKYFSGSDPAGGSDSMTCCIAHREGALIVVDALRENFSPFDPESVVDEHVKLLKTYNVRETYGDRYASEWVAQAYEKRGIKYNHVGAPRSSLYLNLLPKLNSKTVKLLDHSRSINQIYSLERRTSRGERDSVDHPKNGHDDLANVIGAVCFALENVKVQQPPRMFTYDVREIVVDASGNRRIIEHGKSPHKWDGPLASGGYAGAR
jgi:hypothetical protein